MTIDDKNLDEKVKFDINREARNMSPIWSGKIDKYEYLKVKKNYLLIKEEW